MQGRSSVLSWAFSGVPVLEILPGKCEQSLKLGSQAAEYLRRELVWVKLCGSKQGCVFHASLKPMWKLIKPSRQNSSLCGFGEREVITKHLMPVARHSAALFMLLGFRCYKTRKKNWQELLYFLYKCDKIMVENKTSLRGLALFSQSLFISRFWSDFFFFLSILFLWFLTVSTVVYIRGFVKRKNL